MLYYLAVALKDSFNPLNVLTYHTVRAGGAAFTGFAVCLLIGPEVIRWLRALKVGQYIREEHVAELHALHKKKAGTPTMGGALIILATLGSLVLWARFTNRLLVLAAAVFFVLGAVGFIDDYIKLRRKKNKGLSAKAKFTGQIIVGLLLGSYLVLNPVTPSRARFGANDILDWAALREEVGPELRRRCPSAPLPAYESRPAAQQGGAEREALLVWLNTVVDQMDLMRSGDWSDVELPDEARLLAQRGDLDERQRRRLNRFVVEAAFPSVVAREIPNLHSKVEIPGLKEVFLPLGMGYVLFVLLIIVGSSNAVNLTDGLDGLAIGASIIALMPYTAIAYVVSRADWSRYLYLIYVPEASELTVFGAALLGAGMGFLWYNSHPAEVFMGDTGSLALGGALGTMAVLTKQELLLIVVGGLFVLEAASVILQVASFKLRGRRIFRMAPLHHHFELAGWSESKVTIRFWIIALLFALLSLAALKLR